MKAPNWRALVRMLIPRRIMEPKDRQPQRLKPTKSQKSKAAVAVIFFILMKTQKEAQYFKFL
jgi:hypothetical protein